MAEVEGWNEFSSQWTNFISLLEKGKRKISKIPPTTSLDPQKIDPIINTVRDAQRVVNELLDNLKRDKVESKSWYFKEIKDQLIPVLNKEMDDWQKIRVQAVEKQRAGLTANTCPHCGKTNPSDAVFCYNCGKKLEAKPEEKADDELEKITERWWRHCEAIKKTFEEKEILSMVHGLEKYYTKEVVNYLKKLEKLSKQIDTHLENVIITGRNQKFFKENFAHMWRATKLRGLVEEIEELEKMIKPFDNIISKEIKARGTKEHGDIIFLNRLHKAYVDVIKMKNVQDLKALLHTTIPIIKKLEKKG